MIRSVWEGGDIFKTGISVLLERDKMKLGLFLVVWMRVLHSHTKEPSRREGWRKPGIVSKNSGVFAGDSSHGRCCEDLPGDFDPFQDKLLQNYLASQLAGQPRFSRHSWNNSSGMKVWCSFWFGPESWEIGSLFPGSFAWSIKWLQGHLFWIHCLFSGSERLTGVPSDHSQEPAFRGFLLLNPIQNCLSSVLWREERDTWPSPLNSPQYEKGSSQYWCGQEAAAAAGRVDQVK